ncbi:hypothetical protein ABVE93_002799 [Acinetobacter baumannii]
MIKPKLDSFQELFGNGSKRPGDTVISFDVGNNGKTKLMLTHTSKGKSIDILEYLKNHPNKATKVIYLQPSEEQVAEHKERLKLKKDAELKTLESIKETLWNHLKEDEFVINNFKYYLCDDMESDDTPTVEQAKALFMSFDAYLIGQIISFGMHDTEVERSIHEYIEERKK